jgi:selenocysteine-specific elongation factor
VIVGTAGHVDHGKTALVRALTGVDTDRLKEEKARGISIDLGFAYAPTEDGSVIGFVDVPGHERFIHNMLAGATGIDYLLLVVAADDGIMPQTIEHLAIVDLLGVERGLVALSKVDLVAPAQRAAASAEIVRLLAGTGLAGAEIIEVSSVTGEGIATLRQRLEAEAASGRRRAMAGRFRLAVDRSFTLAGAGTIVTGTVLSGSVGVGDIVTISPAGRSARVRSIHAQNRPAERGEAGERCALNLAGDGIARDAVGRGDVVLDPALHAPTMRIDARLRVLPGEAKPLQQWLPVHFHHGAAELPGRIVLLDEAPIAPAGEGWVQLVLDRPIAAAVGDRFILRDTSAQRTIGGGRLVDLRPPARRRRTPQRRAQLTALAEADPMLALTTLLAGAADHVELTAFARDRALSIDDIPADGLVRLAAPDALFALSEAGWTGLRRNLRATLGVFHKENPDHQGMGRERLRLRLEPRLPAPAFAAALHRLATAGEIALDGAWVRLPGHAARLTPEQEALWARITPLLAGSERFRPPRLRDVAAALRRPEAEIRRLLKLAARLGRVDEVVSDHFFLRGAIAETVEIVRALAAAGADGSFTAAQLRDKLDNGRKLAIELLEFLDRHGVTLRRGDVRRVNPHRLDLFARIG